MAERKKKATEPVATTATTAKRGRKPKTVQANTEPVEKPAKQPEKKTYKVECKTVLNVRSGAGKQFSIVRQIPNGSVVSVYKQENGWGRIDANEWVMMQFLK